MKNLFLFIMLIVLFILLSSFNEINDIKRIKTLDNNNKIEVLKSMELLENK